MSGQDFDLDAESVTSVASRIDPEPVQEHYVVVGDRRFAPKQLFSVVTGLDRADFTTHQARRAFRRLGFGVFRRSARAAAAPSSRQLGPHGGAEAALLEPFAGKWVAQKGQEVLVAADDPRSVVTWLRTHDQRADAVFRVPSDDSEIGGAMSQPQ